MKHFRIALTISVLIISFLVILLTGCKVTYANTKQPISLQSREVPTKNSLGKSIAIGLLMAVTTVAFIAIVRQVNKI